MKCRVPRINRKMQKEIDAHTKQRVAEHYEQQGEEITRRVFKLWCVACHEEYGFSGKRNGRLLLAVSKLIEKSKTDEVFWYHIDKELKQMGLDFPNENYEVMDE